MGNSRDWSLFWDGTQHLWASSLLSSYRQERNCPAEPLTHTLDRVLTAGFCCDTSATLFQPWQQFLQSSPPSSLATGDLSPRTAANLSRRAWGHTDCCKGPQGTCCACNVFKTDGLSVSAPQWAHRDLNETLLRTILSQNKYECLRTVALLQILMLSSINLMRIWQ